MLISSLHSMFARPHNSKYGISACVVTKNDMWLEESLLSVRDYVDEFVIVDSSKEEYRKRNEALIKKLEPKDVIYIYRDVTLREGRKILYAKATRTWMITWDGDVVAMDSGRFNFGRLVDFLKTLDHEKYFYEIYFPQILVGRNFEEVQKRELQVEHWVLSNYKKFKWTKKTWDQPSIPLFFRKVDLDTPYALHINKIRQEYKERERQLLVKWYKTEMLQGSMPFEKYREMHFPEFRSEGVEAMEVIPHDERKHGSIPRILEKYKGMSFDQIVASFEMIFSEESNEGPGETES